MPHVSAHANAKSTRSSMRRACHCAANEFISGGCATQPIVFHVASAATSTTSFLHALGNAGSGYGNGMTNDLLPQRPRRTRHLARQQWPPQETLGACWRCESALERQFN